MCMAVVCEEPAARVDVLTCPGAEPASALVGVRG